MLRIRGSLFITLALGAALWPACGNDDTGMSNDTSSSLGTQSEGSHGDTSSGGDTAPADTGTDTSTCDGPFALEPTFEDPFDSGWAATQTAWRRASWMQNGTQMDPARCVASDAGLLEQTVLAGTPFRGGSMQSAAEYRYGRWEARLKPSNVPGALNSMFTMDWDDLTTPELDGDGTHQEVDIEFLTYTFGSGAGKVHFAVHNADHANYYEDDVALDFDPSADFHVWGFDVLPDRIDWRVDGTLLRTFMYDATVAITGVYELFFNSWTKEDWINGPPLTDAVYQIDWVHFHPYLEACAAAQQ